MLCMCAMAAGQSTAPALGGLQVGSNVDALLVEFGRWIWFASVCKNGITLLCVDTVLMRFMVTMNMISD